MRREKGKEGKSEKRERRRKKKKKWEKTHHSLFLFQTPPSPPPFHQTGTGDRIRCAAVCKEWASILSAPFYWRELQLDTADFDGQLRRQQRRREAQRRAEAAAKNGASSSSSPSSALARPPLASSGLLLRRHHHLDRAPADAGARAAFADALLRLAERAGGALERVRVVSARASDVAGGGGGGGEGISGFGGGPRRDGGGAFALFDSSTLRLLDEEDEQLGGEEQEPPIEDEQGAGASRRGAPPRLFYGDGVSLEPFPGARVGFCGPGRELEAWLSATAMKLSALSRVRSREGGAEAVQRDGSPAGDADDDQLIAAGVFGAEDARAAERAELARAEAAASRERVSASARLQAALCGKPFGGKRRFSGAGGRGRGGFGGGGFGGGGGPGRAELLPGPSTGEPLAGWALRVAAYLCFRAFRGALRGVLRWRRGRSARSRDGSYSSRSYSSSGAGAGSAAVDGALTLAAVALAARVLVAAFALPALAVTAARGALSLLAVAAAPVGAVAA